MLVIMMRESEVHMYVVVSGCCVVCAGDQPVVQRLSAEGQVSCSEG